MTKLMGSVGGILDTATQEAMPTNGSNPTGSLKAANGSFDAQKYTPTATLWSSMPQIRGDRFTNFREQGKVAALTTLAANAQLSCLPVGLIEFEKRHLAGT